MNKNIKSILIALVAGFISVFLVNSYVSSKEQDLLQLSAPVDVLIAAKDIPEGTRLDDSYFENQQIPKKFVQAGAILNLDQVRDQITAVAVLQGNQLLGSMLAKSQDVGLSRKIPKGKAAQTVSVNNATGFAGLLQPGDYVDVLVSVEVEASQQSSNEIATPETLTKKILSRILVLAVNQRSHRAQTSAYAESFRNATGNRYLGGKSGGSSASSANAATVTMALEEEQVLTLTLAQQVGDISLSLRSAWEESSNEENVSVQAEQKQLGSYELLGIDRPIVKDYYDVYSRARKQRVLN